jgi:hypothetical protein
MKMTMDKLFVAANEDLQHLQQDIQDAEVISGVLVNIGVMESENVLAFIGANRPEDIPAEGQGTILEVVAGHPEKKPGFTLVCFGPIFVQGELKPVAAYRPS